MKVKVFYAFFHPTAPYAVSTHSETRYFESMKSAVEYAEQLECDFLEIERLNGENEIKALIRLLP